MSTRHQVIFFADVAGSTRLYETIGDVLAHQCITETLDRMRSSIEKHQGRVVETIGDEVLATFAEPEDAGLAAADIQNQMKHKPTSTGHVLNVRIGFHCGPVEYDDKDHPYGDSINTAARVVAMAQAGQIVITARSVENISEAFPYGFRPFSTTHVKGKAEPLTTVELIWDQDEATSIFDSSMKPETGESKKRVLVLVFQGKTHELEPTRGSFAIGRGPQCDIQVNSDMASRLHARIEPRWGEWVLIDHSTNGTYAVTEPGNRSFDGLNLRLHRREWIIEGRGQIGIGQPPSKDPQSAISFSIG